MLGFLVILTFIMLFTLILVIGLRSHNGMYDLEEETTTTTTTTHITEEQFEEPIKTVGILVTLKETNGQRFVLDPVDNEKMYLNSNDDLYEDANGNIWTVMDRA
jgi:hypothetical protein